MMGKPRKSSHELRAMREEEEDAKAQEKTTTQEGLKASIARS